MSILYWMSVSSAINISGCFCCLAHFLTISLKNNWEQENKGDGWKDPTKIYIFSIQQQKKVSEGWTNKTERRRKNYSNIMTRIRKQKREETGEILIENFVILNAKTRSRKIYSESLLDKVFPSLIRGNWKILEYNNTQDLKPIYIYIIWTEGVCFCK